jgi:hypothetical protein
MVYRGQVAQGRRNIFAGYKQVENQFTNGLFALLDLSRLVDTHFSERFFKDLCNIELGGQMQFSVLPSAEHKESQRKDKKTVDGEILAGQAYVAVETKILSHSLWDDQVIRHLETAFRHRSEPTRRLVLLTPDNPNSECVKNCIAHCAPKCVDLGLDPKKTVVHLRWKSVYDYLDRFGKNVNDSVFVRLVDEYLAVIRETIISQDYVGIIYKAAFNDKTDLHSVDDIAAVFKQPLGWGMPKPKAELESDERNPRKLLIYSGNAGTPKAIYYEAQVQGHWVDNECDPGFPCRYRIKLGSVMRFDPPIPLSKIRDIPTLENMGTLRGHVRLRSDVYEELVNGENKIPV